MPRSGQRPNQRSADQRRGSRQPGQEANGRDVGNEGLGPCPGGVSKENMEAISAPYNFVPLADWVHIPEWKDQVSHDLPFRDGFCGEIAYRLVAESPLLVGGNQQGDNGDNPGEVKFFKTPDGYAIPGSSLKGMLRAVVEIAGFGRFRMVDDGRPGLRDITGRFVADSYAAKLRGDTHNQDKVRAGFLHQRDDGGYVIIPCKMVRLDHRKLAGWLDVQEIKMVKGRDGNEKQVKTPIFNRDKHRAVAKKYQRWEELCKQNHVTHNLIQVSITDGQVTDLCGSIDAVPVLTGQISDFRDDKPHGNRKGKYKDFVFYEPDEKKPVQVPDASWRDFLRIHGDEEKGKRAEEMSWPGYWKKKFRGGEQVPVFYVQDGCLLRIGLAYMPKLAGDFSLHNMIEHSSNEHLQPSGQEYGYDLADLLFGVTNGNKQDDSLRGRVSCETALVEGEPQVEQQPDTILNSPKPTYFPNYITQDTNPETWKLNTGKQYATYMETQQSRSPTLRGFKRYPARPEDMTHVQMLTEEQRVNRKIQVRLYALPKMTVFSGRILFHNLKQEELGALLWAVAWGGEETLRHGLGMGKPFGFGQVRFEINHEASRLTPNDPDKEETSFDRNAIQDLMSKFSEHMERACSAQDHSWRNSLQLANLLAMAEPKVADELPNGMELRHMLLMRCKRNGRRQTLNEFQWAKQEPPGPFALPDYAVATKQIDQSALLPTNGTGGSRASRGEIHDAKHPWLVKIIPTVAKDNNIPMDRKEDIWGGRPLAKSWDGIEDSETKAAVLEEIKAYWQAHEWWDSPPKGAKRKAKQIYDEAT